MTTPNTFFSDYVFHNQASLLTPDNGVTPAHESDKLVAWRMFVNASVDNSRVFKTAYAKYLAHVFDADHDVRRLDIFGAIRPGKAFAVNVKGNTLRVTRQLGDSAGMMTADVFFGAITTTSNKDHSVVY